MLKTWQVLLMVPFFHIITISSTKSEITSENPDEKYTTCGNGWYQFGDMCYRLSGKKNFERRSWAKASERCREEYNGTLATIHSRELNDFITAFLVLSVRDIVWIGLHDRVRESVYTWDDGSTSTYFQWEPWEPFEGARESEDCVEIGFHFDGRTKWTTGNWNDFHCDKELPFVCQKEKSKGKSSKRNLDAKFCSSDVGGGWKLGTSCFNFVPEKKSWEKAEEYCVQNVQGHLASIPDFAINLFLNYVLRDKKEDLWIGLRNKDARQKQWASGWQVEFENWKEEEEDVFNEESCVARDLEGKWVTQSCNKTLPFICEYSTAIIPFLRPKAEGYSCPEVPAGWRDLGGDYCYFFDVGRKVNWLQANFLCLSRGATLVSIHSEEEAKMLHNFIRYAEDAIHIGLYRTALHDDVFLWADGSPVEITLWDANEPNAETEKCVEVRVNNFKWNDIGCSTRERGYICSIQKDFSNKTTEVQAAMEPCLSGFSNKVLIGVIFFTLVVAVSIGVAVYYLRLQGGGCKCVKKTSKTKLQIPMSDIQPDAIIVTDILF